MAIFRHRSVEDVMPPDVRRRASDGIGKSKVDWYAGRRYAPEAKSTSQPTRQETNDDIQKMRQARKEANRESSRAAQKKMDNLARVVIAVVKRVVAGVTDRRARTASTASDSNRARARQI